MPHEQLALVLALHLQQQHPRCLAAWAVHLRLQVWLCVCADLTCFTGLIIYDLFALGRRFFLVLASWGSQMYVKYFFK